MHSSSLPLPPLPPLPSCLSTRFLSTINPQTGACKHHPTIQLCELVENNTKWVVRRKICSKCGARAPVGVSRRMPGVSVIKSPSSISIGQSRVTARSQSPEPRPSRERSRSASTKNRGRSASRQGQILDTHKSGIVVESKIRGTSTKLTPSHHDRENKTKSNEEEKTDRHRSRSASTLTRQRRRRSLSSKPDEKHQEGPSADCALASAAVSTSGPSRFHSRALEFTSKILITSSTPSEGATPNPIINKGNAPTLPPQDVPEDNKLDESDPFIIIPVIINPNSDRLPPPPPPRTADEMKYHLERLRLRQASLRREYQERRAKVATLTAVRTAVTAVDPPSATDFTGQSKSNSREQTILQSDAERFAKCESLIKHSLSKTRKSKSPRRDRYSKNEYKSTEPSKSLIVSSARGCIVDRRDQCREKVSSASRSKSPSTTREMKNSLHDVRLKRSSRSKSNDRSSRSLSLSRSKSKDHSGRSLLRSRDAMYREDKGYHSEGHYSRNSTKETCSTRPESLSSTSQSKSNFKIVLSRSTSRELAGKDEPEVVEVLMKKRAQRRKGRGKFVHDECDAISYHSQPMTQIRCSSDELSHASSISESLITNEFDVKDRSLLKSLGAKHLVTRSKSALGGIGSLNSARRKFQSAFIV